MTASDDYGYEQLQNWMIGKGKQLVEIQAATGDFSKMKQNKKQCT